MANAKHLAILRKGVDEWNKWREENPLIVCGVNLSRANLAANFSSEKFSSVDLSGANLSEANLSGADLSGVNLSKAGLGNANLTRANLSRANLSKTFLYGANLFAAILCEADLTGSDLSDTNLSEARLDGADFGEAEFAWTTFGNNDLSAVKGLQTVRHYGPSTIGLNTIYRSKGRIPEDFLRGCGVPEEFITKLLPRVRPSGYHPCFISHSVKDRQFCDRLRSNLQAQGVPNWYFWEDAKSGESVWGEIDRAISIYDKLVLVCSKDSLQSGPVLREIERALNREDREKTSILIPISIDRYIFNDWKHERKDDVLRKVVVDFDGWECDAARYDKAFARLLRDLKADKTPPGD